MTDLPASIVLDGSDIFVEFKGAMAEQYAMQQFDPITELPLYAMANIEKVIK